MKKTIRLSLVLLALPILTNCSPVKFDNSPSVDVLAPPIDPNGDMSKLADTMATTQLNTPVEFNARLTFDNGLPYKLMLAENGERSVRLKHGKLEIVDAARLLMRYTPDRGFRGEDSGPLLLLQDVGKKKGQKAVASVRVQVDNALMSLKPAVAVRGTGCIMCHANITSNVITDFGYGDSYFWGGAAVQPLDQTSIYADESTDPNWKFASTLGAQVIVPRASTASLAKVGAPSLAAYLQNQLAVSANAGVKNTAVVEADSVYIGAPNPARLREVGDMKSNEIFKYMPDFGKSPIAPALMRVNSGASFYYANAPLTPIVCSGDLVIDGVVYLDRPVIVTDTGCRIYATKSVFINGPVTYVGGDAVNRNLQIVSSRSINLGMGRNTCSATGIGTNSLTNRLKTEPRRQFFVTRGEPTKTVQQKLDDIHSDAELIGLDNMTDAACEPTFGRNVAFERMILNAPVVFSRYQGGFRGSIIAEIALMSLDKFVFEFDPVFNSQVVLPLLSPTDYLSVQ